MRLTIIAEHFGRRADTLLALRRRGQHKRRQVWLRWKR